jgi:Caspase domain
MSDTNGSKLYALLIGIDCYLEGILPDGSFYRNLNGCVYDIFRIEQFLRQKLGLTDERIFKLTASKGQMGRPTEPEELWPTYENIVAAFKKITLTASPGDQVYIHYSGHGGRTPTMFPELKGDNRLDESLVPTDICRQEARYLRDVELTHLLKTMVDKRLVVTVVLDSCYSGSATRGEGGAVVRGHSTADLTERPMESLVAAKDALLASWNSLLADRPDGVKPGSGWLPEPRGYVLLAACRSFEGANEYAFDGQQKSGVLTHWLLDALSRIGPNLTYRMLHNRIVPMVHAMFSQQTPQLQGEGDRVVFGIDQLQRQPAINVVETDLPRQRVRLSTGRSQGVNQGAKFAVYPPGAVDYTNLEERLALLEVETPGTTSSWTAITKQFGSRQIEEGSQAVLLDIGALNVKGRVILVERDDLLPGVGQKKALQRVECLIEREQAGWLRLVRPGEAADYQVVINAASEYELWDPQGCLIPHLSPALQVEESESATKLVERLIHLTKYRNVRTIDNNERYLINTPPSLIFEIAGIAPPPASTDNSHSQTLTRPDNTPTLKAGEWLFLRVKNASPRPLNITILDLRPSWGIKQVFPALQDYEPFEPGQEQLLPLRADLPDGYDSGTDVLKVFATTTATSFRWLELPALATPPAQIPAMRSPANALEELLAMYAAGRATTRDAELACEFTDWMTAAVELTVRRT